MSVSNISSDTYINTIRTPKIYYTNQSVYGLIDLNAYYSGATVNIVKGTNSNYALRLNGNILYKGDCIYLDNNSYLKFDGYYGYAHLGIGTAPTTSYSLKTRGDIQCVHLYETSDRRFKKNITPIDGKEMITKINRIDGHKYNFKTREELLLLYQSGQLKQKVDTFQLVEKINGKDTIVRKTRIYTPEFSKGDKYGFLADEIKEVFPEFVRIDSTDGTYAVDYISFIPVLLEAVKEQQRQIDNLENLVDKAKFKSAESVVNNYINSASLSQNVPNPFNKDTKIDYVLPEGVNTATIYIYDMNGKQIKSYDLGQTGIGSLTIYGNELMAGMYMYALIADGKEIDTKRMILTE